MKRKDRIRSAQESFESKAMVAPVAADRSKFPERTCGSCKWCDVRETGYCGNRKTVDVLDGWDRVVVHAGKFGCVNWEKL